MNRTITTLITAILLASCLKNPGKLNKPDLINTIDSNGLSLAVILDTTLADSVTYARVTLTVDSDVYAKYRQASFTIYPIGKFSNDSSTIIVQIDNTKTARASIFSNISGPAYITATVGNITRTDTIIFTPNSIKLALSSTKPDSFPADNNTYAVITATAYDPNILIKLNTITFTTNTGTFSNNSNIFTTNALSNNNGTVTATAYLRDSKAESAVVSATLSNTSAYIVPVQVNFIAAWPNQLLVYPLHPNMIATNGLQDTIVSKLVRIIGNVTAGQLINYSISRVVPSTSNPNPGVFYNTTLSDSTGKATTIFFLQDTSFHGYVHILGTIDTTNTSGSSGPLVDSCVIYVQ